MPVDFGAHRLSGAGTLRAGAALALVLAAAHLAPAHAQSVGPETDEADTMPVRPSAGEDEPPGERSSAGRSGEVDGRARDSVFIYGRKITSSISTLPDVADAPQVINVISAETLSEQGVTSLEQALRNVPGITTQIGEGGVMNGDQFFIRGLSAKDDIYTDGLRDFGVFTRDAFNYGQIEVLKGPSSTTLGRGTTGGGINTTSKTPYLDNGGGVSLAGGSAQYARATADWNQVLGEGLAFRLNAMLHRNEVEGRDRVRSERWGFAPSIGFGLDGATSFTLAYLHQEDDRVPEYGVPNVNNGSNVLPGLDFGVPRNLFYGYTSDRDESVVDTITARLRHEVNSDLTLTSDTKYGVYTRYFQQTVPNVCSDNLALAATGVTRCYSYLTDNNPLTVPQVGIGGPGPYDQTTTGVQNISTLIFTAPLGGLRNELLAGWDLSWQNNDRDQFNYALTRAPKDLLNPAHTPAPGLAAVRNNVRDSTAKDVSIFISDRLWLNEEWSLSAGVRAERYEIDQNTTAFTVSNTGGVTSVYTPLSSTSDFVSPRVSVIYEPDAEQSYYVSYATSATPPGITVSNGSTLSATTRDLEPEENESFEVGARFRLFDERVLVQASVFEVRKNNAKIIDPTSGAITAASGDSQKVSGVELGVAGAITDQWSFNANWAFTDTETTESTTSANIGKRVAFAPKNAASLWTTYNFTGALAGLEAGLGVTHQGDVALNPANTGFALEYTSLDALIGYGWDRYRVSLNVYNLTDELYYSQVQNNRLAPAPERNFVVTLGVVF